jgi:glutamate N-acetyltransferase/amino-acid N-acetyltransferase
MLAPALATMLCVIATDAIIDSADADAALQAAVAATLNRIDSDGCTSTNDTVALMASGASGVEISAAALTQVLAQILNELAQELVRDAEGKTKVVEIKVINAANSEDALEVGRSCARNNLLKCAINGEDPNWGRVLAAVGTTKAAFDPWDIDVWLNGVQVCRSSAPGEDRALVDMSNEDVEILIDLKTGTETASIWTNDLSAMYVHENSAYSS